MTDQVNRKNVQKENPPVRSMVDRLSDFTRIKHHFFIGSKTSKDPIVDELHNIFVFMGATHNVKVELASYQLKDVSQTWCKMWHDSRVLREEF